MDLATLLYRSVTNPTVNDITDITKIVFKNVTIKILREMAKRLRLKAFSKLNKTNLFNLVYRNRNNKPLIEILTNELTLSQLKSMTNNELMERLGKKNDKKTTKQTLIDLILSTRKPKYELLENAFKGFLKSYNIEIINDVDPLGQITITRPIVNDILTKELERSKGGVKFSEVLLVHFKKENVNGDVQREVNYFRSKSRIVLNTNDISEAISQIGADIIERIGVWTHNGSGWIVEKVTEHHINISKNSPLSGSSYIPLPEELCNSKKGLVNIKNYDNECFRWCHVRHLNPIEKSNRITKEDRVIVKTLNYDGVNFPVKTKDYKKIESQNEICISVFGYENKGFFPIYVSKEKFTDRMELLLISHNEESHYVYIKDFNKLMFNKTAYKGRKHFCMTCLQCFSSERVLNDHKPICLEVNGVQGLKMPTPNTFVEFKNYRRKLNVPFVIYADFEAVLEESNLKEKDGSKITVKYQDHKCSGFAYKLVCCYDDKYSKPVNLYRGPNAVYKFLESLQEEVKYCDLLHKREFKKGFKMTAIEERSYEESHVCHICENPFNEDLEETKKVRDHCHILGEYRGAAHSDCNLNFKLSTQIPVFFHNLRGYDSHFIFQEIGKFTKGKDIKAIPNNMEKYLTFSLGKLAFKDSLQFMGVGLEKLVSNLSKEDLHYTHQVFKGKKFDLMSRKGVYPYDYMNSTERFKEEALPPITAFYSKLNNTSISPEVYKHAEGVWEEFNIKNLGEYHDLYLKTDVLLLADVFENFRKTCKSNYDLDPCHYLTAPGLSWDTMLMKTGIKLELISDIDMYQFIEKGMRGGISYIANRYSKANNKYMSNYDPSKEDKHIIYTDANNLYGWAMSQYLPTGEFEWVENPDLSEYTATSTKGLILEVDLEYPEELHDLHNDYPLAPERMKIGDEMLSKYSTDVKNLFGLTTGKVPKLMNTLMNKFKYVIHVRNLKKYIDLGMKLTKIHRALRFNQSPWLKTYIDLNTNKRKVAKNPFEKDFFKLMNNSVFGKTMENIRKRVCVKLCTSQKQIAKWCSRPSFVSFKIFNENLAAIHKLQESLLLNKPSYVGMCVLELSKKHMYDFHYDYIKEKYNDNAKLLFTDTDSLTYEIKTVDIYEDFQKDKHLFDNSDYSKESPFFFNENKKVIGKFKDEAGGVPITEFVALRSKMYSYVKEDGCGDKKSKGIKKCVVKKNISHENYKSTLFDRQQMRHRMNVIKSVKHNLGTYEINKTSLSCFDDKRYILEDGISSFAYGHKEIQNKKMI